MTKQIPMNHKGQILYALCDDEDYPLLSRHCWYIRSATSGVIYATTTLMANIGQRKLVYMHNMILPGDGVDHISRNKLDNQKENLRKATYQENGWNVGKPFRKDGKSKSQFKGIRPAPSKSHPNRWQAYFKHVERGAHKSTGKMIWIGYFDSEIEAAKAYNREIVKYRGENAWLNPIPD